MDSLEIVFNVKKSEWTNKMRDFLDDEENKCFKKRLIKKKNKRLKGRKE